MAAKNTRIVELPTTLPNRIDSVPGRGEYDEQSRQSRLSFLAQQSGAEVKWLANSRLPAEFLHGNIENYIGSIEIPVGLAGPLEINGDKGRSVIYLPLATTEGALVASVSRGARAITESGGCNVHVVSQCMVRAPVFKFASISEALVFSNFIQEHLVQLRKEVSVASSRAQLRSVETDLIGRIVHVRFAFETADAAGQNMTTKCTSRCCNWLARAIENVHGIRPLHWQIEGNMSGDKKICSTSQQRGRGMRVAAEVEIPNEVLCKVLNISSEKFYQGYCLGVSGGLASGMIGYNINIANVIAAMFVATGQDIASVHEASVGYFQVELSKQGIYASMTLTNLIVGTVGGGTGLPGQREMIEALGCGAEGGVRNFAQIICAACLALDLSTMAAVAAGDFAEAHERLGSRSVIPQ